MLFFSALLGIGAAGGAAGGANNIPTWVFNFFVLAIVILFIVINWSKIKK
jgi:uncharacterized membrane protein YhdT